MGEFKSKFCMARYLVSGIPLCRADVQQLPYPEVTHLAMIRKFSGSVGLDTPILDFSNLRAADTITNPRGVVRIRAPLQRCRKRAKIPAALAADSRAM